MKKLDNLTEIAKNVSIDDQISQRTTSKEDKLSFVQPESIKLIEEIENQIASTKSKIKSVELRDQR